MAAGEVEDEVREQGVGRLGREPERVVGLVAFWQGCRVENSRTASEEGRRKEEEEEEISQCRCPNTCVERADRWGGKRCRARWSVPATEGSSLDEILLMPGLLRPCFRPIRWGWCCCRHTALRAAWSPLGEAAWGNHQHAPKRDSLRTLQAEATKTTAVTHSRAERQTEQVG